jgi:hypothetical protein
MRLSTATATILPLVLFAWAIIYRSEDLVMWDWVEVRSKISVWNCSVQTIKHHIGANYES